MAKFTIEMSMPDQSFVGTDDYMTGALICLITSVVDEGKFGDWAELAIGLQDLQTYVENVTRLAKGADDAIFGQA